MNIAEGRCRSLTALIHSSAHSQYVPTPNSELHEDEIRKMQEYGGCGAMA